MSEVFKNVIMYFCKKLCKLTTVFCLSLHKKIFAQLYLLSITITLNQYFLDKPCLPIHYITSQTNVKKENILV